MKLKDLAAVCADGQNLIIKIVEDGNIIDRHYAVKGRRLDKLMQGIGNLTVRSVQATSTKAILIIAD